MSAGTHESHGVQQGQVPHLGWGNPPFNTGWGMNRFESSPAEKGLGVLVGERLKMSQKHAWAAG